MVGSSPLARGLRDRRWRRGAGCRIIPARAGFTSGSCGSRACRRDHPRSREVYDDAEQSDYDEEGSSPLARGLQYRRARDEADGRIIPARAGFTRPPMAERSGVSDHPRSRGVYFRELWIKGLPAGSSPLARGLRRRRAVGLRRGGIIPARAGFTPRPPCRRPSRPDHPRSRGVYLLQAVMIVSFLGSSPLARGLPAALPWGMVWLGIIPARAGFTSRTRRTGRRRWDHPRSRGVYSRVTYQGSSGPGSSPLARGLPAGVHAREAAELDHPRSRGVYVSPTAPSGPTAGSSPLARGLRRRCRRPHSPDGIIPARAGFTPRTTAAPMRPGDHPRSRGVYGLPDGLDGAAPGSSPLARGLPPV